MLNKNLVIVLIVSLLTFYVSPVFSADAVSGATKKAEKYEKKDYKKLRYQMVKEQIKKRGIKNKRVLKAMEEVPRHEFIPKTAIANPFGYVKYDPYGDHPVPIGEGQTISQPYIVALMTELLELKSTDKVLEIGTGSGYQAAILGEIAGIVYTIEIKEKLARWATKVLKDYRKVKVKHGDGYLGWPKYAPFDKIIVTCAPEAVPQPLIDQLKDGGKMVIPVGKYPKQYLKVIEKKDGEITSNSITPVLFVPMLREE